MKKNFKKEEFNLIQTIKLAIMMVGGLIIAGSLIKITIQLSEIIKLLR